MSNKKMIIQNCHCYNNERFLSGFLDDKDTICTYYGKKCQDCADCILKQIVELCKDAKTECECYDTHLLCLGEKIFAEKILNLLDIQEAE